MNVKKLIQLRRTVRHMPDFDMSKYSTCVVEAHRRTFPSIHLDKHNSEVMILLIAKNLSLPFEQTAALIYGWPPLYPEAAGLHATRDEAIEAIDRLIEEAVEQSA